MDVHREEETQKQKQENLVIEDSGGFIKEDFENGSKIKIEKSNSFSEKPISEKKIRSVSLSLNRSSTNSNNTSHSKSTGNNYQNKKFHSNNNSKKFTEESGGRRMMSKNSSFAYPRLKSNYNISKNSTKGTHTSSSDHFHHANKIYSNQNQHSSKNNNINNSITNKNFSSYYASFCSTNVNSLMNLSQNVSLARYNNIGQSQPQQQHFNRRKNGNLLNHTGQTYTTKTNFEKILTQSKNLIENRTNITGGNGVNSNSQNYNNQLNDVRLTYLF